MSEVSAAGLACDALMSFAMDCARCAISRKRAGEIDSSCLATIAWAGIFLHDGVPVNFSPFADALIARCVAAMTSAALSSRSHHGVCFRTMDEENSPEPDGLIDCAQGIADNLLAT